MICYDEKKLNVFLKTKIKHRGTIMQYPLTEKIGHLSLFERQINQKFYLHWRYNKCYQ